jgi:hypothetical protein
MNVSVAEARQMMAAQSKPSAPKFKNRRTVVDDRTFDSSKEAKRWGELNLLERAGEIRFLRTQVRFPLDVNGVPICHYVCDFAYVRTSDEVQVIEDVKSPVTRKHPVYVLKRKLMRAIHGVEIVEV